MHMKTFFSYIFIFCSLFNNAFSQKQNTISSLDSFFAGIPLKKDYNAWVNYIVNHDGLGIDSARPMGIYSSFKNNYRNHFPFPDSIPVKLLLQTAVYKDPSNRFPNDTSRTVYIEGIFGNHKNSQREADKYFNVLYKMLKPYYRNVYGSGSFVEFTRGKTDRFPYVWLETGFFEEQKFYYVLLITEVSLLTVNRK